MEMDCSCIRTNFLHILYSDDLTINLEAELVQGLSNVKCIYRTIDSASCTNLCCNLDGSWLTDKLNRILPQDIAVSRVVRVRDDAHARFDAKARTYHYRVYTKKNPFERQYATRITYPLDFDLMNEAAEYLLQVNDFTSFSKLHTDTKTNICRVVCAHWSKIDDDLWQFEITADRFLRNMVRAVVGTLIEVGRGRMTLQDFKSVIEKKDRCAAGDSMPGNALSLVDIKYDNTIFEGIE